MNKFLRITAVGAAIASLGVASAASAATEQATATAQILAALDITLDATRNTLDFGTIAESGSGGTVSLTPAGVRTCGSGLVCAGTNETPLFTLVGQTGGVVNISFTSPNITLTGPGTAMPVALSLSDVSKTISATPANNTFEVGGTLTVGTNQTVGTYNGTLEVVATYN